MITLASYGAVAWNLKVRIVQINERIRASTAESSCVVEQEQWRSSGVELEGANCTD